MQPYLKAFIVMSIVFLFQGCVTAYKSAWLARDEGMASFDLHYAQCVSDMDATYSKFPIDMNRAYVFKESAYIEKIKGKTSTTVKPNPVLGPFLPVVEKKKGRGYTIGHWQMQCVVENVDLNHNKRLLEVQRCLENRCVASFNEEDWWPDDRMQSNDGFAGPWSENWAISKLEACASCRFSEAKLLAEGGHDSNFVARKLDGFKRPNRLSPSSNSRSDSPFNEYDYIPVLDTVGYIRGFTPIHMFDSARESDFSRRTSRTHLREIIYCDPNPPESDFSESTYLESDWKILTDANGEVFKYKTIENGVFNHKTVANNGRFYITDTPVLASD